MNVTPPAPKPSDWAVAASIVLGVVAGLLWLLHLATVASLGHSDAAGNAIGEAYAAIQVIALWVLLAAMTVIAGIASAAPRPAKIAALVIVAVSGLVAMAAADLLARAYIAPFRWPIIVPALVPPLLAAWCFLTLSASKLRRETANITAGVLLGAALAVCASIWPLSLMRHAAYDQEAARQKEYDEGLAAVPAGAPLWAWTPFLDTPDDTKRAKVLDSIHSIVERQSQAETMLDRGDFPILYLGSFDLDPTASLCEKARSLLRKRAEPLVLATPNSKPYSDIALQVSDAVSGMEWLVGYGCSCDAEATAWESMAKGYSNTNFDVYRLAELRDPGKLGKILRERPEHFSMLNGQSHLRGWLRFADDKKLRDQALAGARALDRRTADAVEILADKYDEENRWKLLQNLPALDLEATTPLCTNALATLRERFAMVYRPGTTDEPRPYSELLERLGNADLLPDLIWLAGHGCAAEPELSDATALVSAYQDSPGRASMLAALGQLRQSR